MNVFSLTITIYHAHHISIQVSLHNNHNVVTMVNNQEYDGIRKHPDNMVSNLEYDGIRKYTNNKHSQHPHEWQLAHSTNHYLNIYDQLPHACCLPRMLLSYTHLICFLPSTTSLTVTINCSKRMELRICIHTYTFTIRLDSSLPMVVL